MPWAKGQSGNPQGRQSKARNRLTDKFIRDLDKDWRLNGVAALVKCREEHPEQYVAIVARLLPKDTHTTVTHELSGSFLNAIRQANQAQLDHRPTTGSGAIIDGEAETVESGQPIDNASVQRGK